MSKISDKFRRRFRVPYPLFKEIIVPDCHRMNVFEVKVRHLVPIEFKILIALRILGRDAVADDCEELSSVGESTCHEYFKMFVRNYEKHFYDKFVKLPEGRDLLNVMEVYQKSNCIVHCRSWSADFIPS